MRRSNEKNYRRFRRLTVRILVDYAADGTMRCAYATTLGAGGLFIETEELIDPGTVLKLRFRLPGGEELHELEGRVVWKRGCTPGAVYSPGMGVQFTDSVGCSKLACELEELEL
jgi:uncharacterized protein (TIGR02266 family)